MKLKTLIIALFTLLAGCQAALAQTSPITPAFRATTPYPNPLDSVIFNFTGKPDGYSSLYTGWYLNNHFTNKSDSTRANSRMDSLYAQCVNLFDSQTISGNKKFKGDVTLNNTYLFLDSADNAFIRYNDSISGYGPVGHIISLGTGSYGGVGFSNTNFSTDPFALFTYSGSSLQNSLLISDTFEPYNQIDGNAAFQIQSTTKGLIFPNMTYAQRSTISPSPYNGSRALTVFQTDAGDKGSGLYLLGNSNVWDRIATLSDIPGGGGGGTVVNSFNSRTGSISPALEDYTGYYIPHFASLTALEVYNGAATTVNVDTTGRGGTFLLLAGSPTFDYGVNFPSAISGHYWHRQVDPGAYYKLEWWGLKGDGTTDNQPAIQRAVNYLSGLGGGTLLDPTTPGIYATSQITWANYVNLTDLSYPNQSSDSTNNKIYFLAKSTSSVFNLASVKFASFVGVSIDGNGETCDGWDMNSTTSNIQFYYCKTNHCNISINGGGAAPGTMHIENCIIHSNKAQGIYNLSDAYIFDNYIAGCQGGGIYINGGSVRIMRNHIEFNVNYASYPYIYSAYGIKLGASANIITIGDNTTDSNAGNDVLITGTSSNIVQAVNIFGNVFKRCAYGQDLTESQSVAISATYCNGLTIAGSNHFIAGSYGSGENEYAYSPVSAISVTNSTNVINQCNNTFNVKNKIAVSANDGNYQWVATGLGDNSYYLLRGTIGTTDYNPEIGQPDQMDYLSHYLTLGTLGSLTTGQYAWGDPASLGYSTLVVRLFWDTSPTTLSANTLFAEYNQKPVTLDNTSSNIRTDRWLSQAPYQTINSSSQGNFTLNTQSLTLVQQTGTYSIIFNAREVSSNARIYGVLPVTIINNASTYPSVTLGTPETLGGSGITLATSGSTGLVVDSVRTDGIGSILKVYVTNHESHNVSLEVDLQNSAGAGLADNIPVTTVAKGSNNQILATISGANAWTTTLPTAAVPAFTGDVTNSSGSLATTVGKIGGKAVSLAGAFTMSGAYGFTGTLTGATTVTFPTSGTLSTLAGSETLTNKTLTVPKLTGYTVATLPAGTVGMIAYVTDALSPVALATVVGGGSSVVPVFYNGSNWIVQ